MLIVNCFSIFRHKQEQRGIEITGLQVRKLTEMFVPLHLIRARRAVLRSCFAHRDLLPVPNLMTPRTTIRTSDGS